MSTSRTVHTLAGFDAAQRELMIWLEVLLNRTGDTSGTISTRLESGMDDNDQCFSLYVWRGHDLIGAAAGSEVFRGGEWLLTTYDIEAVEGRPAREANQATALEFSKLGSKS